MEPCQLIERSIIKKYRKELWTPFIVAVKRYELVQAGDKIAVCISGGKDSSTVAALAVAARVAADLRGGGAARPVGAVAGRLLVEFCCRCGAVCY